MPLPIIDGIIKLVNLIVEKAPITPEERDAWERRSLKKRIGDFLARMRKDSADSGPGKPD